MSGCILGRFGEKAWTAELSIRRPPILLRTITVDKEDVFSPTNTAIRARWVLRTSSSFQYPLKIRMKITFARGNYVESDPGQIGLSLNFWGTEEGRSGRSPERKKTRECFLLLPILFFLQLPNFFPRKSITTRAVKRINPKPFSMLLGVWLRVRTSFWFSN